MLFVETFTQTLVYLCFAILMGGFILYLIPNTNRPEINVRKGCLHAGKCRHCPLTVYSGFSLNFVSIARNGVFTNAYVCTLHI